MKNLFNVIIQFLVTSIGCLLLFFITNKYLLHNPSFKSVEALYYLASQMVMGGILAVLFLNLIKQKWINLILSTYFSLLGLSTTFLVFVKFCDRIKNIPNFYKIAILSLNIILALAFLYYIYKHVKDKWEFIGMVCFTSIFLFLLDVALLDFTIYGYLSMWLYGGK